MILLSRENYVFWGEFLWFGVVLHLTINGKYNRSAKEGVMRDVRLIARSLHQPVYAFQTFADDPLKLKFIQSLGFTFHHYRVTCEGEWAAMYSIKPIEVRAFGF